MAAAWSLTEATTSGTSGCMRHADELSIDHGALLGNPLGDLLRGRGSRGEQRHVEPGVIRRCGILDGYLAAAHGSFRPADRAEAKSRNSLAGKFRWARMARITLPT